jgi:hypothetical protein
LSLTTAIFGRIDFLGATNINEKVNAPYHIAGIPRSSTLDCEIFERAKSVLLLQFLDELDDPNIVGASFPVPNRTVRRRVRLH